MKIFKLLETYTKKNSVIHKYLSTTFSDDLSSEILEHRNFHEKFLETLIDTGEVQQFISEIIEMDPFLKNRTKFIKGLKNIDNSLQFLKYLFSETSMNFPGVDEDLPIVKMKPYFIGSQIPRWWDKLSENLKTRVFQTVQTLKDPKNPNSHAHTKIMMRQASTKMLPRTTWLIHFTDDAMGIALHGFNKGISNFERLGITTDEPERDKKAGGFNFAYNTEDVDDLELSEKSAKYGGEAVLFMNSGTVVSHNTDEEEQVIFWGADVNKNTIVPIFKSSENNHHDEWCVYNKKDTSLIFSGDLASTITWVNRNFNQYKNVICPSAK